MDTRRHAPRKLRRRARHPAQGRDGLDAHHAGDIIRFAPALSSGADPIRHARQYLRRRGLSSRATDRYGDPGFLVASNAGSARWKITSQPAGRCRWRRRRTSPASLQLSAAMHPTMRSRWPPSTVLDRGVPVCPALGRSLMGAKPALQQQSQRPTNDRRLEDLTGLVPQPGGLFVALSLKGRSQ